MVTETTTDIPSVAVNQMTFRSFNVASCALPSTWIFSDFTRISTDCGKKSRNIYTYMLTNVLQGSGKQFWGSPPECLFFPLNAEHVEFSSLLVTEGLTVSDLC